MKQLWLICATALLIAAMKYLSPIIQKSMDIEFVKWMSAPKIFTPSIPNLNKI
jgi:hypothetical protein